MAVRIALRLSGATAIAALIALVGVSLPAVLQRSGNDNIHTARLPNPADVQQRQQHQSPIAAAPPSPERQSGIATVVTDSGTLPNPADVQRQDQSTIAAAPPSLSERRREVNEPPPNEGPEEPQPGIATVVAGPVTDAIPPATTSSPTMSQLKRSHPDNEENSTLIRLGQDFLKNGDFSSARLLLRRAAEAGSAAAALSLGETFDPLVIRQLHAIGVQADSAEAREWYERAAQLGSDAASPLAKLAESPQ
jgi:hypothetical protein